MLDAETIGPPETDALATALARAIDALVPEVPAS
jgi:hypothetical protein